MKSAHMAECSHCSSFPFMAGQYSKKSPVPRLPWHTRPKQSAAFEWEWDSGLDETVAWIRLCCVRFLLSRLERDRPAGLGKPASML